MTPKEKANDLIHKFFVNALPDAVECDLNVGKRCALIAVEEILSNNCGTNTDGQQAYEEEIYCDEYFWHDVKSELQSL